MYEYDWTLQVSWSQQLMNEPMIVKLDLPEQQNAPFICYCLDLMFCQFVLVYLSQKTDKLSKVWATRFVLKSSFSCPLGIRNLLRLLLKQTLSYCLKIIIIQVAFYGLRSKQTVAVESIICWVMCFLSLGKSDWQRMLEQDIHTQGQDGGEAVANYTHTEHCEREQQHNYSAEKLFQMREEQNKLEKECEENKRKRWKAKKCQWNRKVVKGSRGKEAQEVHRFERWEDRQ